MTVQTAPKILDGKRARLLTCIALACACLTVSAQAQQRPVQRQDPTFVALVKQDIPDFDTLTNDKDWETFLASPYKGATNADWINHAHNNASIAGIKEVFDRFREYRERRKGATDDGDWKIYAANDDASQRFFYNTKMMVKQAPYIVVWIRADTIAPSTIDKAYSQRIINCQNNTFTLLRYENYHNEELTSKGQIDEAAQKETAITQGSALDTVSQSLCAAK